MHKIARSLFVVFVGLLCGCGGGLTGRQLIVPQAPAAFAPEAPTAVTPLALQLSARAVVLKTTSSTDTVIVRAKHHKGKLFPYPGACKGILRLKTLADANGTATFRLTGVHKGWCVVAFEGDHQRATLTVAVDEGLVNFSLTIPNHVPRKPPTKGSGGFITPDSKSLGVTINSGAQTAIGLTPQTNPNCTSDAAGNIVCTELAVGASTSEKAVVGLVLYNKAIVDGHIPKDAKPLANWASNKLAIELKAHNNVPDISMSGIVDQVAPNFVKWPIIGNAFTTNFSIIAYDGSGNVISGAYASTVTVNFNTDPNANKYSITSSTTPPALFTWNGLPVSGKYQITMSWNAVSASGSSVLNLQPLLKTVSTAQFPGYVTVGTTAVTLSGNFATQNAVGIKPSAGVTVAVKSQSTTSINASITVAKSVESGTVLKISVANGTTNSNTVGVTVVGKNDIVSLATDSAVGATPGICPAGAPGELRYSLCNASQGDTIIFNTAAMCGATACTITLAAPLPPIEQNQTIDGGTLGDVAIDGAGNYRVFFVDQGTVTLSHLVIQNAYAHGGNGGSSNPYGGSVAGGGGGAGLGAGLFVNNSTALVTVSNDWFSTTGVKGGSGGAGSQGITGAGSGGGGLDYPGGNGGTDYGYDPQFFSGGGGGGVLAAGADGYPSGSNVVGGAGGLGGGGGGASLYAAGGAGGAGYGINSAGSDGKTNTYKYGASGGNGGFGGGGGGDAFYYENVGIHGGNGGLFGGGAGSIDSGGNGGAGGGGGGTDSTNYGAANGGTLATISGGNGSSTMSIYGGGGGGGGAAAGPAIFVNAGTLKTSSGYASDATAVGGPAGPGAQAGGADATPVFNFQGTVNGSTTVGPVSNALASGSPPSVKRRLKAKRVPPDGG